MEAKSDSSRRAGADRKRKNKLVSFAPPSRVLAGVETKNAPPRRARPLRHRLQIHGLAKFLSLQRSRGTAQPIHFHFAIAVKFFRPFDSDQTDPVEFEFVNPIAGRWWFLDQLRFHRLAETSFCRG